MELKFVNTSYFKLLFHNLRLNLQYSKNIIFVTSHFGTLLLTYSLGGPVPLAEGAMGKAGGHDPPS